MIENLSIFSRVLEENFNHASFFKKLCENVSCPLRKMYFLHHFDICDKRDHTIDIDPFLFGKKFYISSSGKYAEQNEQVFTDVLCHVHYNALHVDNLKKEKECLYETSSRTTRYISVLKENVDIFLKTFNI